MNGFQPVRVAEVKPKISFAAAAVGESEKFLPTAVKPGQMPMPPEAKAMVPKLVSELSRTTSVLDYGETTTVKITAFADKMLNQVTVMNIGDFQKPLTDVMILCKTTNAQSIQSGRLNSKMPFFNRMRLWFSNTRTRAISNITSVRDQIDGITKELVKKENDLRTNIQTMEEMYVLNMQEYYALQAHIEALEQVIKMKTNELETFILDYNSAPTKDPVVALEIQNRRDLLDAMDKKLYDLRAISMACLETAPMIRNEQKSSTRSIEKFRSVRSMAIPLWKKQAALMLSSLENAKAASLGKTIDDTTNAMVKSNATQVAQNAVNTARLGQRGVLDVETMEHVNNELIKSIEDMLKIEEEGKQYRANAATKFEELKASLNQNVVARGLS